MSKVSIIIPVYNAEAYLQQCLDSVMNQPLSDLEVICVDDGSTDCSRAIVQTLQKLDSRVKLLSQHRQGPGVARNAALDVAAGEYIYFLDADDRIAPGDALLRACEQARRGRLDILLAAASTISADGKILQAVARLNCKLLPDEQVFAPDALGANLFLCTPMGPCGKLYRRAFLEENKLRFPALNRSEDFPMVGLALALSSRLGVLAQPVYERRIGVASSLESTKDETPLVFFDAEQLLRDALQRRNLWNRFKVAVYSAFVSNLAYNLRAVRRYSSFKAIIAKYRREREQWICREDVSLPESSASDWQLVQDIAKDMDEDDQIALFVRLKVAAVQKESKLVNAAAARRHGARPRQADQISSLKRKLARCQKEISGLHKSQAYRVGMVVTWPARKAWGCVKCLRENGIKYTAKHFVGKLARAFGFRTVKW